LNLSDYSPGLASIPLWHFKVEGKLWVDKQDFGWINVDGQVTQSFSMGLFVARVQHGSHIILEESTGKHQNPLLEEFRHEQNSHLLRLSPGG